MLLNSPTSRLLQLLVLWSSAVGAQPLADFLQSSTHANFDAQSSAAETARASASFGQAWGALLPTLSANGGWTHNQFDAVLSQPQADGTTRTITIVPKDQLDATLRAEVSVIDVSKWAQVIAAGASRDAVEQRARATRLVVQRQVASAFYGWVAANDVLTSARRSLEAAQNQVELRRARSQAGVGNELELSRSQAEVERNQQLVAAAEAAVATRARTLETLSGLAPRGAPPQGEPDLSLPELTALEGEVAALPTVEAAEADARAAERSELAATLALVPSVNAQVTQRFTNATGFQNAVAQASGGLAFQWRLDLVGVNALRVQHANGELARIAAERARRAAADQLHSDWHALRAAVKKVQAARAQVASARRAADLTHERSAAGVATQFDVIQTDRDLFAAEVSQAEATSELATARALLSLSAGKSLLGAAP